MKHYDIIQTLCEAGFPTFIVGGTVRDNILGATPKDVDIATQATPEEIKEIFQLKHGVVGGTFGVTKIDDIDVATFRMDQYHGLGGAKNCEVSYAQTIEEDLSRRDLTINAIALCPHSGLLIDLFNGQDDLKKRIIRFVGDGETRIKEDPDRIIRACRFLAKVEGKFAKDTLKVLRENSHLIQEVAPERLKIEIDAAMKVDHPSLFFGALELIGGLDYVFPGLSVCVNHNHGKHHIENIWEHMMLTGDSISKKHPLVRLAGFLHDCGKPYSFNPVDGSFIGHENSSAFLARRWLKRLTYSNFEVDRVCNIIQCHMIGASRQSTPRAIRKFRKTLQDLDVPYQDWLRLRLADRKGNVKKTPLTFGQIRDRVFIFRRFVEVLPFTVNSLALKGGELIKIFNLTPGPIVGNLQKQLLEWIIEEGAEFNTPHDLEVKARELLGGRLM